MSQNPNILISFLFLVIGFFGVLIMLNVQGNAKNKLNIKVFKNIHRIFGYFFILILLFMMVVMSQKISVAGYEASPRIALHILLSILTGLILMMKILIARYFKKYYSFLVAMGLIVFILSFSMVMIAAGYNLLQKSPQNNSSEAYNSAIVSSSLKSSPIHQIEAEKLLKGKCSVCHTLDQVRNAKKNYNQWTITIKKMINYSQKTDYLEDAQITLLATYLSR